MPAPDEICWDCPICGSTQRLDQPGCEDGHGAECPDRSCAGCSSAFVVDPPVLTTHRVRTAYAA
jgi:hypothetical protein